MPSRAAPTGSRPNRTRQVAPITAQIASGQEKGRRITPRVARPAIPQAARFGVSVSAPMNLSVVLSLGRLPVPSVAVRAELVAAQSLLEPAPQAEGVAPRPAHPVRRAPVAADRLDHVDIHA